MKMILSLVFSLMLFNPLVFAGGHGHGTGHSSHGGFNHPGHEHFDFNHARHEGWRGNHGHFNGFNGTFYGQIVILDDGCWFWNGLAWETYDCD